MTRQFKVIVTETRPYTVELDIHHSEDDLRAAVERIPNRDLRGCMRTLGMGGAIRDENGRDMAEITNEGTPENVTFKVEPIKPKR